MVSALVKGYSSVQNKNWSLSKNAYTDDLFQSSRRRKRKNQVKMPDYISKMLEYREDPGQSEERLLPPFIACAM